MTTIKEFLDNPMGKGSIIAGKSQIIASMREKVLRMLVRSPSNQLDYKVYKEKEDYFFHFIIPSEDKLRNNTYDVVIRFFSLDPLRLKESSLKNYDIQVFSNSPSFVFTYAYVFKLMDMMIDGFEKKLDRPVFKKSPSERNPAMVMSYEKSISIPLFYLMDRAGVLLLKSRLNIISHPMRRTEFFKSIRHMDKIMEEISTEKHRIKSEKEDQSKPSKPKADPRKRTPTIQALQSNVTQINASSAALNRAKIKPKSKIGSKPKLKPKKKS